VITVLEQLPRTDERVFPGVSKDAVSTLFIKLSPDPSEPSGQRIPDRLQLFLAEGCDLAEATVIGRRL
jgi:hypothetical protein